MTDHADPLVSIALCTYNGERYLREQLECLVNQDYPHLEIVVTDDQSSDNTWSILQDYAGRYSHFRIVKNEKNLGYSGNFEKAASLCNGKYIAFSDQDDIWDLQKISKLVKAIGNHSLVYHDSLYTDEAGKDINGYKISNHYHMYDGDSALPFTLANCISGHAMMFKRDLLNYCSPFDPRFYHDWMIAYTAFNVGTVKYLPEVLVHYRQHGKSITDALNLKKFRKDSKLTGVKLLGVLWDWAEYCANFKYNKQPELIKNAYTTLSPLRDGKGRLKAFIFLVKHLNLLAFLVRPQKSFFSTVNLARKIAYN